MMKKSVITISVALTAVLMVLTLSAVHVDGESYVDACTCDHYDLSRINQPDDEYTGTGIRGYYSGNYFYKIEYTSQRGMGDGVYNPLPSPYHLMYIRYDWVENSLAYRSDVTYNTPVPWTYPVNPFGGPYPYYHCQTRYYTDYVSNGEYAGSKASCWFRVPYYPSAKWWCEGTRADVVSP